MTVANPEPNPDAHLPSEETPGQAAPGWYPDHRNPAMEIWWTGRRWHGAARPATGHPAGPPQPQVIYVQTVGYPRQATPQYLSGLSTGQHIVHIVLSVLSFGLWLPIYGLHALLSRRRIR